MLCTCRYNQQVCFIISIGLTNWLKTHQLISDDLVERVHKYNGSILMWMVDYK